MPFLSSNNNLVRSDLVTTDELAAMAGITRRMLRWWVGRGLVKARRNGRHYRFDARHALIAMIASQLRAKNTAIDQIRRWKLLPARADYLVLTRSQPDAKAHHGIRSAYQLHWFHESGLIRRLERAAGGCLVVDVRELRETLERRNGATSAVLPPGRRSRGIAA